MHAAMPTSATCCTRRRRSSAMLSSTRWNRSGLSWTASAPSWSASRSRCSSAVTGAPRAWLRGRRARVGDVSSPSCGRCRASPRCRRARARRSSAGRGRRAAAWEVAERLEHVTLVLAHVDGVLDALLGVVQREAVAHRHEAAAVLVARQVEHDRAQVGGRPRRSSMRPTLRARRMNASWTRSSAALRSSTNRRARRTSDAPSARNSSTTSRSSTGSAATSAPASVAAGPTIAICHAGGPHHATSAALSRSPTPIPVATRRCSQVGRRRQYLIVLTDEGHGRDG